MLTTNLSTNVWSFLGAFLLFAGYACPQSGIHVPSRSSSSLFQGEQGRQKPETSFDPATQTVTVKMLVQDPNGYFIPNIRRDNFAVYENGVRQHNATVEIEHAPVSLTVLMEWGGRYQTLNKTLAEEVPRVVRQLFDELGRQDKIAILKYSDHVGQLADFTTGHDTLDSISLTAQKPEFSELNFYDAAISSLVRMKGVTGRKAIILVSSGVDTFSKAKYEDVLNVARDCGTPIYVINIGPVLKQAEDRVSTVGPYARVDWNRAEAELQQIAIASGGRMYSPGSTFDLSAVYDDIMENLRVRYVITYKSTTTGDMGTPRTVRVELIDPKTGGPLEIVDANRKPVRSTLFFENSYVPSNASAAR
jgi:VWFA-related protein